MATTACRALAFVLLGCAPQGTDGDASDDPGDPCLRPLALTLEDLVIDGSSGTSSPTVSFTLGVENLSASEARVLGYLLECRYLSPDASMIRGSGTSSLTIAPGGSDALVEAGCVPGVVSWTGSPTGDDLRCTVEALYDYLACDGTPPAARASVTGSDSIALITP